MILSARDIRVVSIVDPLKMSKEFSAPSAFDKFGFVIEYLVPNPRNPSASFKKALILACEDHVKRATWLNALSNVIQECEAERQQFQEELFEERQEFLNLQELIFQEEILQLEELVFSKIMREWDEDLDFIKKQRALNRNTRVDALGRRYDRHGPPPSGSLIVPSSRMNQVVAFCREAATEQTTSSVPFSSNSSPANAMTVQPDGFCLTDEDGFILSRNGEVSEVQAVLTSTILVHGTRVNRLVGLKSAKKLLEERRKRIAELNRQLALEREGEGDDASSDDDSDNIDDDGNNDDQGERRHKQSRKKNQDFEEELLRKTREKEKQIIEETTPAPFSVTNITIETTDGSAYFIQKTAPGLIMTRKFLNLKQTGAAFGNGSFAMIDDAGSVASTAGGISYYSPFGRSNNNNNNNRSFASTVHHNQNNSISSPPAANNTSVARGIGWIKWPLGGKS